MTTTETPFLHQVRLARCQSLAKELATLRAKCPMTLGSDRIAYETACKAVEADLEAATGTPQQRALEAALGEAEGQLAAALFEDATRKTIGSAAGVELARQKLLTLEKLRGRTHEMSDYISEAEDTLARLRSLVTSLHTDPELKNRSGTQVLTKFMEVMSLLGAL